MPRFDQRACIESTLSLIACRDAQFQYQAQCPGLDVATELFLQWEDCYRAGSPKLAVAFGADDRAALEAFHATFVEIRNEVLPGVGSLRRFVDTPKWRRLRDAAATALARIRTAVLAA